MVPSGNATTKVGGDLKKPKDLKSRLQETLGQFPIDFMDLHRSPGRIIGYIQVIVASLFLIAMFCLTVGGINATFHGIHDPETAIKELKKMKAEKYGLFSADSVDAGDLYSVMGCYWLGLVLITVETIFQFKAGFGLIKACDRSTPTPEIVRLLRYWFNHNFMATFFYTLFGLVIGCFWTVLCSVIIRMVFRGIVASFFETAELEIVKKAEGKIRSGEEIV